MKWNRALLATLLMMAAFGALARQAVDTGGCAAVISPFRSTAPKGYW